MDCIGKCECQWRPDRTKMNILQVISLINALKGLLDDLKSTGALAELQQLLPEITAVVVAIEAVIAKIDMSKLKTDASNIVTKIEDLIKK